MREFFQIIADFPVISVCIAIFIIVLAAELKG